MTPAAFASLAMQTVVAPRDVARLLIATNLSREALISAFALVIIVGSLIFFSMHFITGGPMPVLLADPFRFVMLQGLIEGGGIVSLAMVGRVFGGRGRLADVAILSIWLNAIRMAAMFLIALVTQISPVLGFVCVGAVTVIGFWIALTFIDEAHGFNNLFKAIGTLVIGMLAMAFALSFLLTLAGVSPEGMLPDV